MDHPRVENLAGLVYYFYCYKILLLHLMGLKLISKFFLVVRQVIPVMHVVGFGVCQTLEMQQEAVWEIKNQNQAVSGESQKLVQIDLGRQNCFIL